FQWRCSRGPSCRRQLGVDATRAFRSRWRWLCRGLLHDRTGRGPRGGRFQRGWATRPGGGERRFDDHHLSRTVPVRGPTATALSTATGNTRSRRPPSLILPRFAVEGNPATATATLLFLSMACSTSSVTDAGALPPFVCTINGVTYPVDAGDPDDDCRVCQP